jgi:ferric-dicitrate binding protein FerR (iron transport regulator)
MSTQPLVTKELLFVYFGGQATALQKLLVEKWVEDQPENEELFYACLHEWEGKHLQYGADTDAAIARFNGSLFTQAGSYEQPETDQLLNEKENNTATWQKWFVAASVLLMLLFGSWLFQDSILYKSYHASHGEVKKVTLADGSIVVLNSDSELQVPRFGFRRSDRQVRLIGEARFSVTHTPEDRKFIVLADSALKVEVLGTEFNLAARKRSIKVVLQEGKVKVLYKETPGQAVSSLIMVPGDLVTVDEGQNKIKRKKVQHPENFSAWQHGRFVFSKTSLVEIKEIIEDNYGVTVELKGTEVSDVTVSGTFKAKSADELLSAISEISGLQVSRQGRLVIIAHQS